MGYAGECYAGERRRTCSIPIHRDQPEITTKESRILAISTDALSEHQDSRWKSFSCCLPGLVQIIGPRFAGGSESTQQLYKYRGHTKRLKGNPYPNPAIGALKSLWSIFASNPSSLIVVYRYVQISGIAERGMPPPSSEILMVMSSEPSTTTTLMGGNESSLSTPLRSTTARSEFLSSSKRMCELF